MNVDEMSVVAAGLFMYYCYSHAEQDVDVLINLSSEQIDEVYRFMLLSKDRMEDKFSFFRFDSRSIVEGDGDVFIDYASRNVYYILQRGYRYLEVLNRKTNTVFFASLQGLERCSVVDLSHNEVVNYYIEYNYVRLSKTIKDMEYT